MTLWCVQCVVVDVLICGADSAMISDVLLVMFLPMICVYTVSVTIV